MEPAGRVTAQSIGSEEEEEDEDEDEAAADKNTHKIQTSPVRMCHKGGQNQILPPLRVTCFTSVHVSVKLHPVYLGKDQTLKPMLCV